MTKSAEPIIQQKAQLGEGALWHGPGNVLYWIDIMNQEVHTYNPSTNENHTVNVGHDVGTVVTRKSGGLVLAIKDGFASLDPDTCKLEMLKEVEADIPSNRFNDGKCDPAGRFWAGSMNYEITPGKAALYMLDTDLTVQKMIDGVTCSNGIVWTVDGKTMYYIDSTTYQVHGYDFDLETGSISNKRVAIETKDVGFPDGMALDEEGMVWVALWGEGKVCRLNPQNGKPIDAVEVPGAKQTTSCAFGGKNLNEMYITSAAIGLSEEALREQPNAGALFRINLNVRGVPTHGFLG